MTDSYIPLMSDYRDEDRAYRDEDRAAALRAASATLLACIRIANHRRWKTEDVEHVMRAAVTVDEVLDSWAEPAPHLDLSQDGK